jgi:hypothetical protein
MATGFVYMKSKSINLRQSKTLRAAIVLLMAVANASSAAVLVASKDTWVQGAVKVSIYTD